MCSSAFSGGVINGWRLFFSSSPNSAPLVTARDLELPPRPPFSGWPLLYDIVKKAYVPVDSSGWASFLFFSWLATVVQTYRRRFYARFLAASFESFRPGRGHLEKCGMTNGPSDVAISLEKKRQLRRCAVANFFFLCSFFLLTYFPVSISLSRSFVSSFIAIILLCACVRGLPDLCRMFVAVCAGAISVLVFVWPFMGLCVRCECTLGSDCPFV